MNKLLKFHLYHHASKGMGETPEECAACQAELAKFKAGEPSAFWTKIVPSVAASVLAAFIVERVVRRK